MDLVTSSDQFGEAGDPIPEPQIGIHPSAVDEIEQLWATLFFSAERSAPRTIVVTGAEPQEGATEVAIALALVGTSSEHGQRIALLDFNLRAPRIASVLDVPPSPGVCEVIYGKDPLYSASTVRCHGRLTIVPAGDTSGATNSTLKRDQIAVMLKELLEQHDHVIIDAPAINRHAAAQTLAGLTDGILLVTRTGATRRESVAEAKKRIELAQGKVLGVVLNMRTFPVPGFLYRRM